MRRASAALLAAAWLGCAPGAKREAAVLLGTVERYRRSDNAAKPAAAKNVAGVDCTNADVCATKRACLDAIDTTARALALKDEVARALAEIEARRLSPETPEAQALPGKLDQAERLLLQGRSKMPACEKKLADLELEFGR